MNCNRIAGQQNLQTHISGSVVNRRSPSDGIFSRGIQHLIPRKEFRNGISNQLIIIKHQQPHRGNRPRHSIEHFEINCGKEFTDWLTDPTLNGGGAVIDFGCYGANLATRLMGDESPLSVYAVLRQNKPDRYPRVDDDATIIVNYPSAVVQIMGSWCWPMGRKDMHVYGERGYIYQDTPTEMRVLQGDKERYQTAPALPAPYDDSFRFLRSAVRGEIEVPATDLSSLENNLVVMRILDAAIRSAREKRVIPLDN